MDPVIPQPQCDPSSSASLVTAAGLSTWLSQMGDTEALGTQQFAEEWGVIPSSLQEPSGLLVTL